MSDSQKGRVHTLEARAKMRISKLGCKLSEEHKANISAAALVKGTSIKVLDLKTNVSSAYVSIRKAAEMLGVTHKALSYHFKKTNSFVFKGRYLVEKVEIQL